MRLAPGHERSGFGKVGPGRAAFEALLARAIADQAFAASGDFGDRTSRRSARAAHRARSGSAAWRRYARSALARGFGLRVVDRVAGLVPHRPRADIAELVDVFLHLPGREGAGEVVDDVFFAVAVYVERGNVRGRARPAFERR
jgi:hypothetical protein